MNFKTRLAFIFQPYLWISLLGLFAAYGQYTYFEHKITSLCGIVIFIMNFAIYLNMLRKKTLAITNITNMLLMPVCCITIGMGFGKSDLDITTGLTLALFLLAAYALEYREIKKIVKNNTFEERLKYKPELTIYIRNEFTVLSTRFYKYPSQSYTYLNNGIKFDASGVKDTRIFYYDIEDYLETAMISMNDFNADNVKTIEMLKI